MKISSELFFYIQRLLLYTTMKVELSIRLPYTMNDMTLNHLPLTLACGGLTVFTMTLTPPSP